MEELDILIPHPADFRSPVVLKVNKVCNYPLQPEAPIWITLSVRGVNVLRILAALTQLVLITTARAGGHTRLRALIWRIVRF